MRLGIDLDGVVADFNAGWMQLHAQEFGSDLRPEMVDACDCLCPLGGCADIRTFCNGASPKEHGPSIFRYPEPSPLSLGSLRSLLYRFEINIRASAVLGILGAGGIGGAPADAIRFEEFGHAGLAPAGVALIVGTITVDPISGAGRSVDLGPAVAMYAVNTGRS